MKQPQSLSSSLQKILPEANLQTTFISAINPISLWLIDQDGWNVNLNQQQAASAFNSPPYWCFCWGSGLALAEWIGQNRQLLKGKSVLDFGSGSGVVAIAASLAGAVRVIACDIDPVARVAITENARLNGVVLETLDQLDKLDCRVDFLFAADVLYDPDNLPVAESFTDFADQVVIAESRRKNILLPGYSITDQVTAVTMPDLGEKEDVKQVRLYKSDQTERVVS